MGSCTVHPKKATKGAQRGAAGQTCVTLRESSFRNRVCTSVTLRACGGACVNGPKGRGIASGYTTHPGIPSRGGGPCAFVRASERGRYHSVDRGIAGARAPHTHGVGSDRKHIFAEGRVQPRRDGKSACVHILYGCRCGWPLWQRTLDIRRHGNRGAINRYESNDGGRRSAQVRTVRNTKPN